MRPRPTLLPRFLISTALALGVIGMPPQPAAADADGFIPVLVSRLLDTRPGFATVDGAAAGGGRLSAGSVTAVQAAGRAGVPAGVSSVALNVTATGSARAGFVTVFPCGPVPGVSTVNFAAGQTVAGSTVATLDSSGRFCVFAMTDVDVVVDVTGAFSSGVVALQPGRLFDSRPAYHTTDGQQEAEGLLQAGSVTTVHVAGRLGVPVGAEAAALTITVTEPAVEGFVAVYPCGPRPLVSTVNHHPGQTISNSAIVPLDNNGDVCVFTVSPTHLAVDVTSAVPAGSAYTPVTPARLADTRFDGVTIDGGCSATGRPRSGGSMTMQVAGRAGVPATGVGAVVVNLTTLGAKRPGYLTAFTPEIGVPNASSINFVADDLVSNGVILPVDAGGAVSLFVNTSTHVVVDVIGWFPGASTAPTRTGCAGEFVDPRPGPVTEGLFNTRQRCAIVTSTGGLKCWITSQLGARVSDYDEVIAFGPLVELAQGAQGLCFRRVAGTVVCSPTPHLGGPSFEVALPPVVDLAAASFVACAIDSSQSVWCWSDPRAPQRIELPASAVAFLPSIGSIAVRLMNGTIAELAATYFPGSPAGTPLVELSSNPATLLGYPVDEVEAVSWISFGGGEPTGCIVLVDGRAMCDAATVDLAPDLDIVVNGESFLVGWTGEVRFIIGDESPPRQDGRAIRVASVLDCVGLMLTDNWCLVT